MELKGEAYFYEIVKLQFKTFVLIAINFMLSLQSL